MRRSKTVLVRVPASTSNLGSGFDTLGLALNLYNQIRVTAAGEKRSRIVSPIAEEDRPAAEAMIQSAADEFFRQTRSEPVGIKVAFKGSIPVARGLGYSATVRLGVVAALNKLAGAGWDRQRLLHLVTFLEGHPDNASPAIFGGFTVSGMIGETVQCLRFPVRAKLKMVTLIPQFKLSTQKARSVLPTSYSRADATHGLNRAALITAAFASGDYSALRGLFDDLIHQPYRELLIPQLAPVIRAGEAAGAIGGFLSGAGSGVICLTMHNAPAVARAMRAELPDSVTKILEPDNEGFQIINV